jgi:very-short-patch-repair endonuclease
MHRAIFATFSGPLPRRTVMWGTVLAAGDGAAISHYSAAEVHGFMSRPVTAVHVTIPWPRRAPAIAGAVVHISRRLELARHATRLPPQTRVEETVLDLIDTSATADEAISWIVAAVGPRLTTRRRLIEAMGIRKRLRWRLEARHALDDVEAGSMSALETRYFRDVEQAHGLPTGKRQARHARLGGTIYDDVHYSDHRLVVELDGRASHTPDALFRDLDRDNIAAIRGDVVLHYGWNDVSMSPCRVASQVSAVLKAHDWTGHPRRCRRPECVIGVS